MRITDPIPKVKVVGAGAGTLDAVARRWRVAWWGVGRTVSGIRDPRLRGEVGRLLDAFLKGQAPESVALAGERSAALASTLERLLGQFEDERAGAAEIRLVVHKRDQPGRGWRPDSGSVVDVSDGELVWELRRLLAASGGMVADVALALERRGDAVDVKGRELLGDELSAVEVDIAILKTLLADPVDWDRECGRLLAGEIPPFEDRTVDDEPDQND